MLNAVQQSLYDEVSAKVKRELQYLVGEPNDDLTREQIRVSVQTFLEDAQGDQQYESALKRFKVVCDASNNPPMTVIDRGELCVQVEMDFGANLATMKQRQNINAATAPIYGSGSSGTFRQSITGIPSNTISAGTITAHKYATPTANPYTFMNTTICDAANTESTSPDLPKISFKTVDENGNSIRLHLETEPGISANEVLKIAMLLNAVASTPHSFSVYAYVKKQNLERHFRFEQ